jgi:hypothetical protein
LRSTLRDKCRASRSSRSEPPVTIDGADPAEWVPRYQRAIDRGRLAAAMVTAIKGTGDVELLTHLPRVLLVPLMSLAIRADAAKDDTDRVRICDLVRTVRYDAQLQREAARTRGRGRVDHDEGAPEGFRR